MTRWCSLSRELSYEEIDVSFSGLATECECQQFLRPHFDKFRAANHWNFSLSHFSARESRNLSLKPTCEFLFLSGRLEPRGRSGEPPGGAAGEDRAKLLLRELQESNSIAQY